MEEDKMQKEVELIISRICEVLKLESKERDQSKEDDEEPYNALALCVIDAVYSMGVRYESTERTVSTFCNWRNRNQKQLLSQREYGIGDFLQDLAPYENQWDRLAEEVFDNRQRTSSRSGILKAEAVYRFARALAAHEIDTRADATDLERMQAAETVIKTIPGQGSGISFKYFCMLAGDENFVKPDRMVRRFVAEALNVPDVEPKRAAELLIEAAHALREKIPNLTATRLDYEIWVYQRTRPAKGNYEQSKERAEKDGAEMVEEDWILPVGEGIVVDGQNGRWSDGAFFDDEDIPTVWHPAEPAEHVQDRRFGEDGSRSWKTHLRTLHVRCSSWLAAGRALKPIAKFKPGRQDHPRMVIGLNRYSGIHTNWVHS